jgi:hypothetical protein
MQEIKKLIKRTIWIICILGMILVGCGKEDESTDDYNDSEKETGLYDELTEEQKEYLKRYYEFTDNHYEEMINKMTYETINSALQGTGFELYNKTSGVEVYGIEFKYSEDIDTLSYGKYYSTLQSFSDRKITLEEVYAIRSKDIHMKIDDFLEYSFISETVDANITRLLLEIDTLSNVYVCVEVKEDVSGIINMTAPYFLHRDETDIEFSVLYDKDTFEAYVFQEPYYSSEGKLVSYIKYNTVTNKSLVYAVKNITKEEIVINQSYAIYKLVDDEYKEIISYDSEVNEILGAYKKWEIPIQFATNDNQLDRGTYKIVFGKCKDGYLYEENDFIIE